MTQDERLLEILLYLKKHQTMSIHTICENFQVSRDTARRDILKLLSSGIVTRTYGGISLPVLQNTIKRYQERIQEHSEEKEKIATEALTWIKKDGFYFLDPSTTVQFLAQKIQLPVSIFTNALDLIEVLSEKDYISTYSIGGKLYPKNRFFYSPGVERQLLQMRFDAAFIGVCAICEDGIYYNEEEDVCVTKAAIAKSDRVIILAESDKFNTSGYFKGADWNQISMIITNRQLPEKFINVITEFNIQAIIV